MTKTYTHIHYTAFTHRPGLTSSIELLLSYIRDWDLARDCPESHQPHPSVCPALEDTHSLDQIAALYTPHSQAPTTAPLFCTVPSELRSHYSHHLQSVLITLWLRLTLLGWAQRNTHTLDFHGLQRTQCWICIQRIILRYPPCVSYMSE